MNYLLDTNACVALINNKDPSVRHRFQEALAQDAKVLVSTVVAFEFWYGAARARAQRLVRDQSKTFFAGRLSLLAFEPEDAKVAGPLRANLEAVGKPIGACDLLIAGQALRH